MINDKWLFGYDYINLYNSFTEYKNYNKIIYYSDIENITNLIDLFNNDINIDCLDNKDSLYFYKNYIDSLTYIKINKSDYHIINIDFKINKNRDYNEYTNFKKYSDHYYINLTSIEYKDLYRIISNSIYNLIAHMMTNKDILDKIEIIKLHNYNIDNLTLSLYIDNNHTFDKIEEEKILLLLTNIINKIEY